MNWRGPSPDSAEQPRPRSQRAASRAEKAAVLEVSEHLGNTPSVARKSYIDPRVFDLFEDGTTIAAKLARLGLAELPTARIRAAVDRAVLDLLSD
ncbi:MAG TPA: hypothetical protein VIP98_01130 [Microlunatus sp.]